MDGPGNTLTTDGARADFGALIDAFLPIVTSYLQRDGQFAPIAGYLDGEGEAQGLRVTLDREGHEPLDDPERSVSSLETALRAQAERGLVKAAVIMAWVRMGEDEDATIPAIWSRFEHADGSAMDLYLPYDEDTYRLDYGGASASRRDSEGLAARQH